MTVLSIKKQSCQIVMTANLPVSVKSQPPCMMIRGLQRLLMILGVKVAVKYSKIAECALNSFSVAQVFAP